MGWIPCSSKLWLLLPLFNKKIIFVRFGFVNRELWKRYFDPNITANLTKAKLSDLEDLISSIITANESTDSELRRRIAQTGKLSLEEIELFLRLYKSTICDLKQLFKRNAVYSRLIGE